MTLILVVCGGRSYRGTALRERLVSLGKDKTVHVFTGDANGADRIARNTARDLGWSLREFKADWKTHGRAAGPVRNKRMLEAAIQAKGVSDRLLVLAATGGRGTADMTKRARKAGLRVILVP